jgi:hypothetical protein
MSTTDFTLPEGLIHADLELEGMDGNGFMIASKVRGALKRAGNSEEAVSAVFDEMLSGDYNHLLQVAIAVTC